MAKLKTTERDCSGVLDEIDTAYDFHPDFVESLASDALEAHRLRWLCREALENLDDGGSIGYTGRMLRKAMDD